MEDRILSVEEYEKELADEKMAAAEEAGLQQQPTPKQTVAPEEEATARGFILDEARHCVCRSREEDYGSPEDNFKTIAKLWSAYTGSRIEAKDVAAMMVLLKAARIAGGSRSMDNWVDIAGYAAYGEIREAAFQITGHGAVKIKRTDKGGVKIERSRTLKRSEETV